MLSYPQNLFKCHKPNLLQLTYNIETDKICYKGTEGGGRGGGGGGGSQRYAYECGRWL